MAPATIKIEMNRSQISGWLNKAKAHDHHPEERRVALDPLTAGVINQPLPGGEILPVNEENMGIVNAKGRPSQVKVGYPGG
jgi:hypothetical protein